MAFAWENWSVEDKPRSSPTGTRKGKVRGKKKWGSLGPNDEDMSRRSYSTKTGVPKTIRSDAIRVRKKGRGVRGHGKKDENKDREEQLYFSRG